MHVLKWYLCTHYTIAVPVIPAINPLDYHYHLPENRIPDRPVASREGSKLLVYQSGKISGEEFSAINKYLPVNSLLVFNNSKVIQARLFFDNSNGAQIEILCLHPLDQARQLANGAHVQTWKCMVGNLKKWKEKETLILSNQFQLQAALVLKSGQENDVAFTWKGADTFFTVLEAVGQLPLPPYMLRKADQHDKERYQTVYATTPGSVAAPTAGLHFTEKILHDISTAGHQVAYTTLHVGAGTFKPVKTDQVALHTMHAEYFEIRKELVHQLLKSKCVIPVGTTSARVLESVCLLGKQFCQGNYELLVPQWAGFEDYSFSLREALEAILGYMERLKTEQLAAQTRLMIVPGYTFQLCKGIVTNFHQPESTLILLVAALIGSDWKKVYNYALENNFRFLSYGDSSLLIPKNEKN